nr:EAL domain-containing protein [uncultured Actinoplanes sp.]
MTTRAARACLGAWTAVLTVVYYVFPVTHLYTWALLGYSSAATVLVGVRLNRPARRLPWYLIAAALVCFTSGDTAYNVIVALGRPPDFPGLADLLYLLVYPLLTGAFLIMVRSRSGGANRAALLDALVPAVGFGLLSWVYWIAPFTRSLELSALEKVVSIGYPIGDVLALSMLLRMLTLPGRRPPALTAISIALSGLLASDVFYGQSQLNSAWAVGGPVDLGWIVFYATLAGSALMPSMRELTEPVAQPGAGPGTPKVVLMASAALIAPVVLYMEWIVGGDGVEDAPVIAAAATLMFLAVIARVNGLAVAQRQARRRERELRHAGASLFAAATEKDAVRAVRDAVARLMPAGEPYRLSLTERGSGGPGLRLITAAELPPGVPSYGFDTFLYAALPLPGRPGTVAAGLLGASGPVLRDLLGSFEQLFAQIEVVLQRIGLTGEVNRRDSEAYFRTLIQNAADVILIINEDDTIRYASPSATAVFGYQDLAGTPLAGLVAPADHPTLHRVLAALRDGRSLPAVPDLRVVCAGGRHIEVECAGRDLRDDPTVRGVVLTVRDVTERRRLERELSHLAFHDGLTGLANRVMFRNRLEQQFASATLAVLFVDLDDFKEVNDTLGHAVGDSMLVTVGHRISEIVGTRGLAARMGGDEFAILVELSGDEHLADELAGRVVAALAVPVEVGDGIGGTHIVSGGASVGLATNHDADSAAELLRHADLALYQAKGEDKGTWRRYRPELHTAMVQRLETRTALQNAVEAGQLAVMYQPIVDLHTGLVAGVESLVRWDHPTRGRLGPAEFIEVAEESGAIVGIGNLVLRSALEQFAGWRRDFPDLSLKYVSVNVSARQFRTPGFVGQVRAALAAARAAPSGLLLEITESLLLRDADQVWADLRELRDMGVRIAIDDFGTGYSSLSYLREMPVDVLKLDKSFIDDILASDQQRIMVDTIVTLARNLDLAVIAEGIEHPGQRAALARMGCPFGQGYLFSAPVWPAEIPGLTDCVHHLV